MVVIFAHKIAFIALNLSKCW